MARGGRPGKKRTQYVRDAQGQFASTPGGGKKATPSAVRKAAKAATLKGGTLAARTSLSKSRAKLKSIDKADQTLQTSLSKRAQKGAVTRGSKKLTKAIKSNQTRLIGAKPNANTIKKKRPVSMAYVLKSVTRSMSPDDAQRITGNKPLAKRKIGVPSKLNTIKKNRSPIVNAKTKKLSPAQNISQIVKDATPGVASAKAGKAMRGGRAALPSEKSTKLAASNKPKRELVARVARADKVDNKLKAQLKQAKASGNLKKEHETISRMQRVNRFNQTYNFADLKASRRALTPAKPTAPKRTPLPRTSGTVAKPKGLKPGALAARRIARPNVITEAKSTPGRIYRTKKQAAAAHKDRARRLMERGRMAAGADEMLARTGSLKVRYSFSRQQNMFGGVNQVRHKKAFEYSNASALGISKAKEKRGNARIGRVNARLVNLDSQRDSLISKMTQNAFKRTSAAQENLRKIEKSIRTVRNADDYYGSNRAARFRKTAKKLK